MEALAHAEGGILLDLGLPVLLQFGVLSDPSLACPIFLAIQRVEEHVLGVWLEGVHRVASCRVLWKQEVTSPLPGRSEIQVCWTHIFILFLDRGFGVLGFGVLGFWGV